ncbi:MAG: DNA-processing protein DprA [Actinobacteria bacterium]|nr:DNA-processing protein DprA [Actinomycetota bacterium]
MILSDDAKAVLVLTTRLGDRARPSLSPSAWHRLAQGLADAGLPPAAVFTPEFDAGRFPPLDADRVQQLLAGTLAVFVEADALASRGIWVLTVADPGYPTRLHALGEAAPPCLFGVGEAHLLETGGLAVVGSRNVEPEGAAVAQELARAAVAAGQTLVSGGARGVDQLAMNAAHQAGGAVIGVLGDSLEQRIRKADMLAALDDGKTCLVVQQHPAAGFSVAAAMARNKLVYALADLTVVVAADDGRGGTWSGAEEALRKGAGRVAVWRGKGEGPGNQALERLGAAPLHSAEGLESIMHRSEPAPAPRQLNLL